MIMMVMMMDYSVKFIIQGRLNNLTLLRVEKKSGKKNDFDHIIDQFESVKARPVT